MKLDKRLIVRKRTQQLVYLELGRDNGGVMLNLSEDGCSFQAITPVKCGETRFAFQISGGRRIAGEAEVMWVDDVGIMGGLRFLNLPAEARKQIRLWLQETNAPEEHGTLEPAARLDAAARGSREEAIREASAESMSSREYRSSPFQGGGRSVEEETPLPSAWAHLRAASSPGMRDERFAVPLLQEQGSFVAPRARSVALWRALAVLATAAAIALLLVAYQHEVGDSLIWLGETLSGKTKASVVTPENKATPPSSSSEIGGVRQKPEEQKADEAGVTPKRVAEAAVPAEGQPARLDTSATGGERQESVLEKQVIRDKPETWDASESVESLWGAVQGGSLSAERSLAERFVRGEGVAKNCEQAKVLLKAAANRGSREARLRLYELETQGCH
jgi:TPR repeat protein